MSLGLPRTGWPPGLLQDDSRELSQWLASRPGARYQVRMALAKSNAPSKNLPNVLAFAKVKA